MSQGLLFQPSPAIQEPASADPWRSLRYYQAEACQAIVDGFTEHRSQLAVLATGLGKTQIFSAIARMWPGNVLVLAHREELVEQAKLRLEQMTGESVEVEQADRRASRKARIVVGSVDTVKQKHRLDRFGKDHFGLVICDEAHHYTAKTYMRPLEFFDAKVLGVTATPDRGDEQALGKVFDSVAYCFDILQGIEAGYLVPIRGRQVELGEIQLDGLAKVAGDLAKGQLDEVMVRAVEGIVHKTLELEPGRQGIAFFPGVKSAAYAAERFNALLPGSAVFISGDTPPAERQEMASGFKSGKYRYLCNCMIACLDSETEILTRQGWVSHEAMTMDHEVANWRDGEVFFARPLGIEVRQRRADERIVTLDTPRLSMRVTDDHRVVFRKNQTRGPFEVLRAHEVADVRGSVPISGMARPELRVIPDEEPSDQAARIRQNSYVLRKKGMGAAEAKAEALTRMQSRDAMKFTQPKDLTRDDCWFIGFWLGDGGLSALQSGGVECKLHNDQKHPRMNEWIDMLLECCGFDAARRFTTSCQTWSIGRGTGFGAQKRRGFYRLEPYLKKSGSDLFWALSVEQFTALLQGFWMADGNHGDASAPPPLVGHMRIYNTNRVLLDLIQSIAVCRGMRCSLRWRLNSQGRGRFASAVRRPIGRLDFRVADAHIMTKYRMQFEEGWKPEIVWCVKSVSSLIIARRKGSVFVTGNTEGFDAPACSLIIQGRPTLSRALYAQMVGRGTRVLPGTVDALEGPGAAPDRRLAVFTSAKPDCMVLDYVGNATKHALMTPEDLLGGDYTDKEVELAKKKAAQAPGSNAQKLLAEARTELARVAAAVRSKVTAQVRDFNPFAVLDVDLSSTTRADMRWGRQPPTEKQLQALAAMKVPPAGDKKLSEAQVIAELAKKFSQREAVKLLAERNRRHDAGLATYAQLAQLKRFGLDDKSVTFANARKALDYVAQACNWKPERVSVAELSWRAQGLKEQ